jgi:tetratricopeptide (TPR) repeat protein
MNLQDALGNPVSLSDPAGLEVVNRFVLGFPGAQSQALDILGLAEHDDAPYVQACAAALKLFGETPQAPRSALKHIARGRASAVRASEREMRLLEAVAAWAEGDLPRAIDLHLAQAHACPRDLPSIKIGQYHCFNLGDSPRMLRMALAAATQASDCAPVHGMVAFGYEQCHLLEQAEASARRAIAMQRQEPWSHHALAHVLITQGRFDEGLAFMDSVQDTWVGLSSFMVTHNHWHRALFLIEQLRLDEALALHDQQVWGVNKDYSQDQIGSVSLLARLELAGQTVGEARWQDVADRLVPRIHDHVQPFLDMHYLYGLARAGRPEADALMNSLIAHAQGVPLWQRAAWQEIAVPACTGLLAYARGRHAQAAAALGQAMPRLAEIGGSHAQRDLFEQMRIDALIRAGHFSAAQNVLQPLANLSPASRRLAGWLDRVYPALGLPGSARVQ